MHEIFGGPPRRPGAEITQREMDIAASIQSVTEEIMLRCARHVASATGMRKLVLAGGVALNCVANGRILREGVFEDVWIQPAAGDAGGALGAALFVWNDLLDNPRRVEGSRDLQQGSFLGPRFDDDEIRRVLDGVAAQYRHHERESDLLDDVAEHIAEGRVVGLFQGRMEFGPRALGGRSILGDARSPRMQSIINLKVKFRESFRPFAPSVLADVAHEWFEIDEGRESPYMLLVADVAASRRTDPGDGDPALRGIDRLLKVVRSQIPAVTHVDGSARLQTVDEERHGLYYRLLRRFEEKTGCPVVINTSFNVRGEPIVCSPDDAYRCFMATNIDVLVLESFVLIKDEQPGAKLHEIDERLSGRELD